ncbi:MAG: Intracellular protease, PfpI family [candidate division TM6 bacterium GW2011_GWF2_37_49]|nr:MAG: Intracellular protease, PfpI family [candidate division TM6 bacterium GW2011_GWF2_37_49]
MTKMFVVFGFIVAVVGFSVYMIHGVKAMNKRILFILMPKGYQDIEFNTPYKMLVDNGCTVDVAGLDDGTAQGALGGSFTPNKLLSVMTDADIAAYDALVIPGGPGSIDYLWNNAKLNQTIKTFYNAKKIVASICHATAAVAKTGILNGKKATGFPSTELKKVFNQEGVDFVDQGCFVDKSENIITAQSPKFAKEFGQAIINMLE